ncbi:MAG: hypothetical protein ACTSUC_19545 [Promethearchaeota archaeon]
MLYAPGWKIEVRSDLKIFITKCKFIGDDYGESYYRTAFRNGDFLYSQKFGLLKENDNYYIATFQPPKGIVKIEKSYMKTLNTTSKEISIKNLIENHPETVSEILYSEIIDLLIEEGYNSPIKTRGFLGRKSKGILSNRGTDTVVINNFNNSKRNFNICEAETFRLGYDKDNDIFLVIYNPRYEIYEKDFLLSQLEIKKGLLEKNKKLFLMNPKKIIERYRKIDTLIKKLKERSSLIKEINNTLPNDFKSGIIEMPKLVSRNGKKIEFKTVDEFSKKIKETFMFELDFIDKSEIGVLFDKTIPIPKTLIESINSFGFKTKIFHFNLKKKFSESLNKIDTKLIFYIINDNLQNSNAGYHYFKEKMDELELINKVIRYTTIENKNEKEVLDVVRLSLLGLLYRKTKEPFWKLLNNPFDFTISITKTTRWNGYINILSITIDLPEKRVNFGGLKLRNDFSFLEIYNDLDNIFTGKSLGGKRINIIAKYNAKDEHINEIMNWFKKKGALVTYSEVSERDEGRIFTYDENGNFLKPKPGSHIKISDDNKFAEFLLITSNVSNEKKYDFEGDSDQIGFPQPLRIKIESKNKVEQINVLKNIFWRTFIHPTSFIRPRLPIDLIYSEKNQSNIFKAKLLDQNPNWSVL